MNERQQVASALQKVLPNLSVEDLEAKLERPKDAKNGDYAFPTFFLAKELHKAPQMIASELAEQIDQSGFEKVVVAGPYINFFLDKASVGGEILAAVLADPANYGSTDLGHQGHVTIDLSSPNIAKPMGMGHLRSTVIGNAIANILAKVNYVPVRINHLGDWGDPVWEVDGRLRNVGGRSRGAKGPDQHPAKVLR